MVTALEWSWWDGWSPPRDQCHQQLHGRQKAAHQQGWGPHSTDLLVGQDRTAWTHTPQHACWDEGRDSELISHHKITEEKPTCWGNTSVPTSPLGAMEKERGPASDSRRIWKHSQNQTVREPGDMWREPAESAASNSANPLSVCVSKCFTKSRPQGVCRDGPHGSWDTC